jgi:predicted aspartyl protease
LFESGPEEELENTPEQEMEEAGPSNSRQENPAKKTVRKKKGKVALPVLATMAEPYDILEDLAHQKANITVAQLIQTSPAQRTQLSKGMRRATTLRPTRKRKAMFGQKLRTTSAWCEAKIGKNFIDLIIDTGASGCVASYAFIKEMGLKIQRKSHISMSDINGVSKQPLGAIDNLPLTIDGIVIPAEVDITEAKTYSVIVGMDFLNKIKANIDIRKGLLTFEYDGEKGKVAIKFIHGDKGTPIQEETSSEEEETEEEDSDEYEEQDLENKTFLMYRPIDDWTITRIGEPREYEDEDSVEFITQEVWTPVPTYKIPLYQTNFHNIPMQIIRSVPFIKEVAAYQEGMKVREKKFTWDDYNRLNNKFKQQSDWTARWSYH